MMKIFTLEDTPTPEVLDRATLAKTMAQALLGLLEREKTTITALADLLESEAVHELIDQGKLTLAMIRPGAQHNKLHLPDLASARAIRESIDKPLVPIKVFSLIFDVLAIEQFYQGEVRARQEAVGPYYQDDRFHNRWEEFVALMTSGPTTVLLLHSDDGKAIQNWRDQVGHWDIRTDQPNTIRGIYGKNNYNNLVHGSDSPAAVKRELSVIADQLRRLTSPSLH